jgi:hypothetical protein
MIAALSTSWYGGLFVLITTVPVDMIATQGSSNKSVYDPVPQRKQLTLRGPPTLLESDAVSPNCFDEFFPCSSREGQNFPVSVLSVPNENTGLIGCDFDAVPASRPRAYPPGQLIQKFMHISSPPVSIA